VNGTTRRARRARPAFNRYLKCGDPAGRKTAQRWSVSSTELRLGEIKDKAAPRVTLWGFDHLDRFFATPASTVHASGRDRRERTNGSRGGKQWIPAGRLSGG
jgi:hypothetical protein